ncbi:MAG: hypothetical protein PUC05_05880 [Firmicutes bacterium]|nr:hypothetical protein [Bacillota bacterium]
MVRRITNILSAVLLLAMGVFCVFATPGLIKNAQADILGTELNKRRAERYSGVITIWQTDSFEGGTGSRTAWLNRRLGELEKRYNGVYFAVKTVSPELLPAMLERSRPDLICFGTGTFTPEQAKELLMPLSTSAALIPPLLECCGGLAVPLYFGSYCLLTGTEYASRLQSTDGLADYLNLGCGSITHNRQKTQVTRLTARCDNSGLAALAMLLEPGSLDFEISLRDGDGLWDCYNYDRLCATALCSQRQLYRLTAAAARGRSRASVLIPLSGYTDMVQAIGIIKGAEGKKLAVLQNVVDYLLSGPVQQTVNEIGLLPAGLNAFNGITYDNQFMQELAEAVRKSGVCTPSLFFDTRSAAENAAKYLTQGDGGYIDRLRAGLYGTESP